MPYGQIASLQVLLRGEAEALVLRAQADAEARAMRAKGEAEAIGMLCRAIHEGKPDREFLAYQYLRTLPEIAKGDANKLWIVPSELGHALESIGGALGRVAGPAAVRTAPLTDSVKDPAADA